MSLDTALGAIQADGVELELGPINFVPPLTAVPNPDTGAIDVGLTATPGAAALPMGGELVAGAFLEFGDSTLFVTPTAGSYDFSLSVSTDSGFSVPDSNLAELHYNGPPITILVRAALAIEGASTGMTVLCSLGIALDGDMVGQEINTPQSRAFGSAPIGVPAGAPAWLHTSRLLVLDGDDNVISLALCTSIDNAREATSARMQFWQVASAT